MRVRVGRGLWAVGLWMSLLLLHAWPLPAGAFEPTGACCSANGACADIGIGLCRDQGGTFIGEGTTCANIDCSGRVAAPVVSILGVVGIAGALSGLGVYTLIRRRRQN